MIGVVGVLRQSITSLSTWPTPARRPASFGKRVKSKQQRNERPTDCDPQLPCLTYGDKLLPQNNGICRDCLRTDGMLESMHSKAFAKTVSELTVRLKILTARQKSLLPRQSYALHCKFAHNSGLVIANPDPTQHKRQEVYTTLSRTSQAAVNPRLSTISSQYVNKAFSLSNHSTST